MILGRARSQPTRDPFPLPLPAAETRRFVLRVGYDPALRQTRLFACDLATKQWFQTAPDPWAIHRDQLRRFGIAESTLALTDDALNGGSRDAQFPALTLSLRVLVHAGFQPLAW